MLAAPGALEAILGYYRAMFDPARAACCNPNARHKDSRIGRTYSGPIGAKGHSARWAGTSGPSIGR